MVAESDIGVEGSRRKLPDRRVQADPLYDGSERRSGRGRRAYEVRPNTENLLQPADPDRYLSVRTALAKIGQEFDYLETDETAGRRHVEEMIETISGSLEGAGYIDHRERVKHLAAVQADAIHVRCGDNPTSDTEYLSLVLVPAEPIAVQFESLAHEIAARPLLRRLADALGYQIVEYEAESQRLH